MPLAFAHLRRTATVLAVLLLMAAGLAFADWRRSIPPDSLRTATYVGRQSCIECHQQQAAAYAGSDHDRAMEIATDETVLGDFKNAEFDHLGEHTKFFRDGQKFMVNAEGPVGNNHDYEVKWTFGIRPLQQYMVELPDGRIQVLRVSWDVRKKQWFYVAPPDAENERIEATVPLHWTGLAQNWNTMCAECHSTDYHKNYDVAANTYHSTYNEIDVSCEACHGPGSVHVELARRKSLFWDRNFGFGLTNKLKNASKVRQMETCAPCHSRRALIHPDYRPGDAMYNHFDPMLLYGGLYYADGQIQDEVYEFGSFTQSKMYHKGVMCSNCHDPHSLKIKFDGNRLCAQCHQPGKYDGVGHHHHANAAADAPETQCITCHMPTRAYMEIDDRRDHSIRVPRPDLTVEIGTPNVCNRCHTKPEEDAAWAAAAIVKWYGDKRPDDPPYASAFAAAQGAKPDADQLVRKLLRRQDVPDIVRATAVAQLAGYPTQDAKRIVRDSLSDDSPAVRAAAVKALLTDESPAQLVDDAGPLLKDPIRSVRLAAASRLLQSAPELATSQYRIPLDQAIAEFREAQGMNLDRADAHMALASLSERLSVADKTTQAKYVDDAISEYHAAIRVEPYRAGPRRELAILLTEVATDPALADLRAKLKPDPEEIRRLRAQEVDLLERDAKLVPGDAQIPYLRGLLLYQLGDLDKASESLEEACRLQPDLYNGWLALGEIYGVQKKWDDAGRVIQAMKAIQPDAKDWKELLFRLRQMVDADEAQEKASAPHDESLTPQQTDETPPAGNPPAGAP